MEKEQKQEQCHEILTQNGFDLDIIDATYWSESQCNEFLSDKEKGLEEAKQYIESL